MPAASILETRVKIEHDDPSPEAEEDANVVSQFPVERRAQRAFDVEHAPAR